MHILFFSLKFLSGEEEPDIPEPTSLLNQMPSPRFIKTHLPVELLPKQIWLKKPKVNLFNVLIYIS